MAEPVLRSVVFNNLTDAVNILDENSYVVDFNTAAHALLPALAVQRAFSEVTPDGQSIPPDFISKDDGTIRLAISARDTTQYLELRLSSFRHQEQTYRTLILRDVSECHELEEQYYQTALRYNAIFEKTNDAVFLIDLEGIHLDVNQRASNMLGYSRDELIGMTAEQIVVPEEYPDSLRLLEKLRAGETPPIYERTMRKKNGELLPVEIDVAMIRDDAGKPLYIQSIVRDISERKEHFAALEENEERFRDLFENANDLIQIVDGEGRLLYVNKAGQTRWGTLAEVSQLTLGDILREDQLPYCYAMLKEMQDGQDFDNEELVFVTRDGRELIVEGSLNARIEDGKFVSTRGIFRDVTRQKQIQDKLRHSEARYHLLGEGNPDYIVVTDTDCSIQFVNHTAAGVTLEQVVGLNALAWVPSDYQQKAKETFDTVLHGAEFASYEVPSLRRDGSPGWLHVRVTPIREADQTVGLTLTMADITQLKQTQEKLRQSEERMRAQYKGLPVPTYTWRREDDDFVLIDHNDATVEITQGGVEQFMGINASVMYQDIPEIRKDIERCFKEQKVIRDEMEYEMKTVGVTKNLDVTYAYVAPDLVMIHTDDVTEQKQAEHALRESEQRLQFLVSSSPAVIYTARMPDYVPSFVSDNGPILAFDEQAIQWLRGFLS